MKKIICKKCGATIDASLGECPNCGAMYYILPEDDDTPPSDVRAPSERDTEPVDMGQEFDLSSADNDELFNTSVWKTDAIPDPDATRAFRPSGQQPVRRQGQPQPSRRQGRQQPRQPQRQTGGPGDAGRSSQRGGGRYVQEEPPGDDGRKKRTRRLIVGAAALLAILTLIIALMSNAFNFSNNNEDKIKVPYVLNDMVETATAKLELLGFEVETEPEYNDAPEGTVIKQSLKAGKLEKEGATITLTVSRGPRDAENSDTPAEEITVPYLINSTYEQAKRDLDALGLKATRGEDQYSDYPAGTVISQNPNRGEILEKGDSVLLIVSKGAEPSPSPTGFSITVTVGNGGTVSPKGVVTVPEGGSQTFTITPNNGYQIREVKVNGKDVGAVTSYTFDDVTSDQTLYVVFQVQTATPSPSPSPLPETPSAAEPDNPPE